MDAKYCKGTRLKSVLFCSKRNSGNIAAFGLGPAIIARVMGLAGKKEFSKICKRLLE